MENLFIPILIIKKPDIIQFLLLNGADPNIVNNNEMNSLTFAIKQYMTDISVALMKSILLYMI